MSDVLRLNLGAGGVEIEGYTPVDRKLDGQEVYPLEYDTDSVEDIYASHVFEHFSYLELPAVLANWVDKLKPGGRIRLAVPNFGWIAENYIAGKPINTAGYVMGGHVDKDDVHGAIFDSEFLAELMMQAGLERIGHFESDVKDCSSLPVSLNMVGFKPLTEDLLPRKVCAILSAPRFGPVTHFRHAIEAFGSLKIPFQVGQGAYWHQVLSVQIEDCIKGGIEHIIVTDYDSVFGANEVRELWRLARKFTEADAICGIQMKRGRDFALFGLLDKDGKPRNEAHASDFERLLTQISTGHFGLTIFKTEALRKLTRPWFEGKPNKDGRWADGHVDADIQFWLNFKEQGFKLFLANRLPIGHIDEVIKWPSKTLGSVYQDSREYGEVGIPEDAWR